MTDMPPVNNATPSLRRRFVLGLAALAVSLLILELGCLVIYRMMVPPMAQQNISSLTRVGDFPMQKSPNTFWHHDLNPEHPKYRGRLNAYGTKGPEFELPKPAGEFRVVCVGNSTVEGTGVGPEETYPRYLEGMLAERLDLLPGYDSVKVINGGVGSHNSAFNLSYLALKLLHFEPDAVVIKSTYNDYLPYSIPGMGLDYTHAFPNPYHRESKTLFWGLARFSHFLKLVGFVAFPDRVAVPFPDFSGELTPELFHDMDFSHNAGKFFIYAENIRSMILLCRGRGIDVHVLDLPTSPDPAHFGEGQAFSARFKELIVRLEGELARVTAEEQVPFVRTGPFGPEDFWDHVHNTPPGNRKVAEGAAASLLGQAAAASP